MCRRALLLGLLAALLCASPAAAAPGQEAVFALTKGCYGLRAVDAGQFVVKDAAGYRAGADVVGGAEPFRMQATTLGQYMLYGRAGDFLVAGGGPAQAATEQLDAATARTTQLEAELTDARQRAEAARGELDRLRTGLTGTIGLPGFDEQEDALRDRLADAENQVKAAEGALAEARAVVEAARRGVDAARQGGGGVATGAQPGPSADWVVTATGGAMRLTAAGNGQSLTVGEDGRLATTPGEGSRFTFEPTQGCATFPEAEINVTGDPTTGVAPSSQVRGLLDAHIHMMAFEFIGGRAHCGRPWSPFGITVALVDCPDHGVRGETAVLENALSTREEPLTHDTSGWPGFVGWPTWGSLTHEQTYYRWLERAWRGGLRVYVNLFVENRVLCEIYPYKQNSCDEMDSVRLQNRRIRELEAYIDAQEGGPGKGWFRIVTDPFEARRVINDGKLAVVLGIEVSEPFGCRVFNDEPLCTREDIARGLDEMYDMGVRDMELINKFDNALGGVAGDNGQSGVVVNNGNKLSTGSYWQMETCTGPPEESDREQPAQIPYEHNHDDLGAAVLKAFTSSGIAPIYGPGPHCNKKGLTDLGRFMVERMIDKQMIVDPDHLSVKAREQLLGIVEKAEYPGIVSSHSWSTPGAVKRILEVGGAVAPYAGASTSFVDAWKAIRKDRPKGHFGLGYGADMNGFGKQGPPRGADAKDKVTYPFKGIDPKITIHQNKTGTRTWDINTDGVAHYGLYPDWVEDLRKLAGNQIVEDLAQGAESYLQMWERTEGIPARTCLPARERLARNGLDDVQVGRSADATLRAAGQPDARPGRTFRYCAKLPGGDEGTVTAVVADDGEIGLVGSANAAHKASGIGVGDSVGRLLRKSGPKKVGSDLVVRRLDGGNRFVWGVSKGRVTWTAVAAAGTATDEDALREAVEDAGLVR